MVKDFDGAVEEFYEFYVYSFGKTKVLMEQ